MQHNNAVECSDTSISWLLRWKKKKGWARGEENKFHSTGFSIRPLLGDNYAFPNPRRSGGSARHYLRRGEDGLTHARVSALHCSHPVCSHPHTKYPSFFFFRLTHPRSRHGTHVTRNVQIGSACRFLERPSSSSPSSSPPPSSLSPSREPLPPPSFYLLSVLHQPRVRPCRWLVSVLVNGKHFRIGTPSLYNLPLPPQPPLELERTEGVLSRRVPLSSGADALGARRGPRARIDRAPLFRILRRCLRGLLINGITGYSCDTTNSAVPICAEPVFARRLWRIRSFLFKFKTSLNHVHPSTERSPSAGRILTLFLTVVYLVAASFRKLGLRNAFFITELW